MGKEGKWRFDGGQRGKGEHEPVTAQLQVSVPIGVYKQGGKL